LVIWFRRAGVNFADRFDSDSAGVLAPFCASHPVSYNGQTTETGKRAVILRLPIRKVVFIVFPMAPNIGEASGLDSRTDFHSPPSSERQELYATGMRLTFVTLTFVILGW